MSPGRRRILLTGLWAATIVFWITIFVLTHLPAEQLPKVKVTDRWAHFIAYAVLSALLYLTSWVGRPDRRYPALKILAIAAIYGALDELLQPYVRRTADVHDWLFDIAGAAAALLPLVLVRRLLGRSAIQHRPTPEVRAHP